MGKQVMTVAALLVMTAAPMPAQTSGQSEAEQVKARQNISMMEGVFERAVRNGADNLRRQVEQVMPDAAMLMGVPKVRGFRLENYGVVFDVEVPALNLSIAWIVQSMQSNSLAAGSALADLKSSINRMETGERERMAAAIRRLELALGVSATPQLQGRAGAASAFPAAQSRATVQAQSVLPPDNPNEAWTREVKAALVDAMLEYSGPLALGDNEWLAVAARDNVPADPLVPGDATDSSTVIFRVKGSDLAALHSKRLTMDEARKRVEVREY
jgi:hypothetical protein